MKDKVDIDVETLLEQHALHNEAAFEETVRQADIQQLQYLRMAVEREMTRVASLGEWPARIDVRRSLLGRVPTLDAGAKAPGFDAGIACCLYIIPENRQRLAATLHANYSEEAVEQVRRETTGFMSPDCETAWWLAASAFCKEGGVDANEFLYQVEEARESLSDTDARHALAIGQLEDLKAGFELRNGVAWATRDGGMQGAYIAGHDFAVQFAEQHGIWFVGTFRPSLGLEDFTFSSETDDQGRAKSGPVHGSRQFVKCTAQELAQVLTVVLRHLSR